MHIFEGALLNHWDSGDRIKAPTRFIPCNLLIWLVLKGNLGRMGNCPQVELSFFWILMGWTGLHHHWELPKAAAVECIELERKKNDTKKPLEMTKGFLAHYKEYLIPGNLTTPPPPLQFVLPHLSEQMPLAERSKRGKEQKGCVGEPRKAKEDRADWNRSGL